MALPKTWATCSAIGPSDVVQIADFAPRDDVEMASRGANIATCHGRSWSSRRREREQVVQLATGESLIRNDDGKSDAAMDWVFGTKAAPTGGLEVTSNINGPRRAFWSSRWKFAWETTAGEGLWLLQCLVHADLRQVNAQFDSLLVALAQHSSSDGCLFRDDQCVDSTDSSLAGLGVTRVFRFRHLGIDSVVPQVDGTAGPCTSADVTDEVRVELSANSVKLVSLAPKAPGELFVWLDDSPGAAALVIGDAIWGADSPQPPEPGLTIPVGMRRFWAATGWNEDDRCARVVWMCEGGNWKRLDPALFLI